MQYIYGLNNEQKMRIHFSPKNNLLKMLFIIITFRPISEKCFKALDLYIDINKSNTSIHTSLIGQKVGLNVYI